MILAQTMSGGALNENYFVAQWKQIHLNYPNFDMGYAQSMFVGWWSFNYAWAKASPMTTAASPTTSGILVGFLYDPNTPYRWAQQVKANFPQMSMVTSQAQQHCLAPARPKNPKQASLSQCWNHVETYLKTGVLPMDGVTCEAPLPVVA